MRLLLVEDDPDLGPLLLARLQEEGHVADLVADGEEALWLAGEQDYDVVVLDVDLPGRDGIDVCRTLRAGGDHTPVLMLTGRGALAHRVEGLDAGADDYLPKPFHLAELEARLRALGRRADRAVQLRYEVADVVVDPTARTVTRQGGDVPLAGREYALVELLARHGGRVVSRDTIAATLWDFASDVTDNALDVLVSGVRGKLDRPFDTSVLRTVRGVGYRLG
ncbi:response regulator transcription factor [Aquipuribacter nitratireducens]|uniref:Response regulator transcription factor n=1 Tax=Aquipuribacter nitratireducens TaxID=650104 RepID=A0ABW0GLY8_9MICO